MSSRFRKLFLVSCFFLSLAACSTATPTPTPGPVEKKEPPTILVVGKGVVEKAPDGFIIELSVSTCGAEVQTALAENNSRMREVLDYLHGAGIPDEDVATTNFAMTQEGPNYWDYCFSEAPFRITNGITLTIRDIQRTGEIVSGTIEHGINEIRNMTFFLQEPSGAILEARQKAIQDARAKAQTLAEGLGFKLGDPIKTVEGDVTPSLIREVNVSYGQAYVYGRGGGGGGGIPLAIGNVDITVTLNITYELI
jgi:uncharacterized protein YggE